MTNGLRWSIFQLGIAHLNKGVTLAQLEEMEHAEEHFNHAVKNYQLAGGEVALPNLFTMAYSRQMRVTAIRKRVEEAQNLSRKTMEILNREFGADSDFRPILTFSVAMCLFTIGDISDALRLHKEIYERRLCVYGASNQATLSSQYILAVMYRHSGDLEQAE
jgi:tetratricopeptide (TPR) repeat protein